MDIYVCVTLRAYIYSYALIGLDKWHQNYDCMVETSTGQSTEPFTSMSLFF